MTLEIWLAYVLASTILLLIPGPTILLIVSYALAEGRRSAWGTVAGATVGDVVAVTLSCIGLGALLAASAELFMLLKWLGAAYLVYLGIKMIRTRPRLELQDETAQRFSQRTMFLHAFLVTPAARAARRHLRRPRRGGLRALRDPRRQPARGRLQALAADRDSARRRRHPDRRGAHDGPGAALDLTRRDSKAWP